MALITEPAQPRVGVNAILDTFNSLFKNREELSRATGWPRDQIDTIDFYQGSSVAFHFPTRDRLLSVISEIFTDSRFVSSGTYELAERCPLLVAQKP